MELTYPAQAKERFEEIVSRIVNKCQKEGIAQPAITETGREFNETIKQTVITVNIDFNGIGKDGTRIVALLDHVGHETNVVTVIDADIEIPDDFKQRQFCDVCNTNRQRLQTYVLKTKDGEFIQSGKDCIDYYFPHSMWIGFNKEMDEEMEKLWSGWQNPSMEYILLNLWMIIEKVGYVSNSRARQDDRTESTVALLDYPAYHIGGKKVGEATEEQRAFVKEVIEYFRNEFTPRNDFEWNLHAIMNTHYPERKFYGYIAYAPVHYQKYLESMKTKKAYDHFGEAGQKITGRVRVLSVKPVNGHYGTSYLHRMESLDGHYLFVWFASNPQNVNEGDEVTVSATIKGLSEYNGEKQINITRGKISK